MIKLKKLTTDTLIFYFIGLIGLALFASTQKNFIGVVGFYLFGWTILTILAYLKDDIEQLLKTKKVIKKW